MAREIRILHTADTHLGYRQYHSEVRRQDFFKAFELVINDAVDMQVDAVVHAGDLFDSRNPTLEDLLEAMRILSRLKAADVPFFGIVGNHESKQNMQWLDLFEGMGLAARLGKKPRIIGGRENEGNSAAIYGIDSVPKSKIPIFDYSGFETPENYSSLPKNCKKLLVMHQIVQPFPYAEWDCAEVLEKLPFKIDLILLGDYHKYEKIKVGDAWATYPGSTERNSSSESESRSYNIITLSDEGMEISRRTIPTRPFLTIPVNLNREEKPFEQIFSAVNERLEELPGSVVFLEISGDSRAVLSMSEIEEYLLSKGVLVPRVRDLRIKESFPDEVLKVAFSDPDHAVASEIKRLSLNDGGLIVDEIVRSLSISRSRVDEETEARLSKLIEAIDFKDPNFKIEISARPEDEIKQFEYPKTAAETELQEKTGSELSTASLLDSPGQVPDPVPGSESSPFPKLSPMSASKFESHLFSEPSPEHPSEPVFETVPEPQSLSESSSELFSESISEIVSESLSESVVKTDLRTDEQKTDELKTDELEAGKQDTSKLETDKLDICGLETDYLGVSELETNDLSEEKSVKVPERKPDRVSDIPGKTVKAGQKRGKGKPAVPKQYNLGDYL